METPFLIAPILIAALVSFRIALGMARLCLAGVFRVIGRRA